MKFNHIHMRERSTKKDIVVCIVGDNKSCTCRYSTVNKLIVIWIILYEIEPIAGRNKLHMRVLDNSTDNNISSPLVCKSLKNFCVFFDNLVGNAQNILPRKNGIPNFAVGTPPGNALYQAVCIENDSHGLLHLVKIHPVDFVETVLVENTFVPEFIKVLVHLRSIITTKNLLHFEEILFCLHVLKHSEQMHLRRCKYSWFHTLYMT